MNIVVISPTYNEKENILNLIPILEEEVFPKIKHHQLRLLIMDDNSPDGTGDVVKEFMKKWDNIFLQQHEKAGLGAAYIRGMKYAMHTLHADAVVEFDSDFQHDPKDIIRFIEAMDKSGADYIIGSRYVPGGKIPPEWGLHRKIMSYFGSMFARVLLLTFNIHDMTSGYKLTKTKFLRNVDLDNLYSKYYAYKIQVLYELVKLGAKVKEVPIIFYERKEGSSKISRKDLFDSFWVVVRLRIRESQRFIKFLIIGGTGFVIQVLMQEGSVRVGFPHSLAVGIGAESAIISNFLFNHYWTFKDTAKIKENASFFAKLLKFNTTSVAAILIQVGSVAISEKVFGTTMILFSHQLPTRIVILFPTIIFLVIPLNYLIYNRLIWKTQFLKTHEGSLEK